MLQQQMPVPLDVLKGLEQKILWLSTWMVHNANHIRPNEDGLKVGGHQASSASLVTIMTALWFSILKPEDRIAVKPHAAPVYHAIHYLLGNRTRAQLEAFRGLGGVQSYPSRTKDGDDVDFSTGSVGLGVAQTLFASLVQDYVRLKGLTGTRPEGRLISLVGDAELDEGNIYEALIEGWKQGLRNCWWVIDYNRQSLDAVIREGLWEKIETIFRNFGWDVVIVKYGTLLQQAFEEPGGAALRTWINTCPNQLYAALCYQGGAAFRKRMLDEIGDQGPVTQLIERRNDAELLALMSNLGGHDLPSLIHAFSNAGSDRPVCFILYTIKGLGLPLQGHKDNHAGLMTPTQLEAWQEAIGVRKGHEWEPFEATGAAEPHIKKLVAQTAGRLASPRRLQAATYDVPARLEYRAERKLSTQQGFGLLLQELARSETAIADRIVTCSPDVTVSTNLGPWVNRRGLFAHEAVADLFRKEKIPSTFNWDFSPKGQHFELGIAENNLCLMLAALGLSHSLNGERLLPIGTLYDPFINRCLDALNHACYQDARFILVGTPSGITLAPEGGAHQSIGTPLIGMSQDGLSSFEPAFIDELEVILRWSLAHMQKPDGGSSYLRLTTRALEQPQRTLDAKLEQDIIEGAYWLRKPGPNPECIIVASGAVVPEAIQAVGELAGKRRDVGLMVVTSADRLYSGWKSATQLRAQGAQEHLSPIETRLAELSPHTLIVTVLDGHPATLSWLGGVRGHRTISLGVDHFGRSATIKDLYRHFGLDARAILEAVQSATVGPRLV
jgi:pyruvate dehydrogenase E1 component